MAEKNFRCWIPIDKIEKAKDADGNAVMKFAGFASTKREDTDGESLDPANFDVSYLKERGVINYNHNKNPDSIIGEPTKVEIKPEGLWIESTLYPDSQLAKSVYKLGQTLQKHSKKRRLGYSIEGQATERDPDDPSKVLAARITGCAITMSPKNCDSLIDIVKGHISEIPESSKTSENSIEEISDLIKSISTEKINIVDVTRKDGMRVTINDDYEVKIEKALEAGEITGRDTTNSTVDSGAPLKTESVDGVKNNISKKKKVKKDDDEDQEDSDGGEEFLEKSEIFEKIFQAFPGIGFEKAEKIFSTLNNLTMKSDKTKVTDKLLKASLDNLKLKKGDDEDDMEEGVKPDMEKGKEDNKEEDIVKNEKEEMKKAAKTKKLDDEADKEDDEDEDDEEETKTTEKEELKKGGASKKKVTSKKLDDEEDEDDDKGEDDMEEQDSDVDDDEEDNEESEGDDTDAVEKGIEFEKALRDTSHLVLKESTDKNGKKTRKWTDPTKGEKHHDIKPGSTVKYEHSGKEHHGTVKFVAKNGQYALDTKKHGVIGKHPHQVKKVMTPSNLKKGITADLLMEGFDTADLQKSIDSLNESFGSKFQSLGILLKGVFDNQVKSSEEFDSLKENLSKSLEEIEFLKGLVEEIGNEAPIKKSVTTSARQRNFVQGDEMKKGLDTTTDSNEGKIILSVSRNKQKIIAAMDALTFEKGLDNNMANAMTLFESSSYMEPFAEQKLLSRGIKIVK